MFYPSAWAALGAASLADDSLGLLWKASSNHSAEDGSYGNRINSDNGSAGKFHETLNK